MNFTPSVQALVGAHVNGGPVLVVCYSVVICIMCCLTTNPIDIQLITVLWSAVASAGVHTGGLAGDAAGASHEGSGSDTSCTNPSADPKTIAEDPWTRGCKPSLEQCVLSPPLSHRHTHTAPHDSCL